MDMGLVIYVFRNSLMQLIIMVLPVLLIGMLVGLVISVFQATTSLQEQTLTFVPKILAILMTIIFLGPWMLTSMQEFTMKIILMIPQMVK
ncbi:MAG: flagellar biosynthesis protein FliQ [Spirochaetia bacterium]|nr:flagellar biosynthesis protein FliQ [Spirochaetia bacterium]